LATSAFSDARKANGVDDVQRLETHGNLVFLAGADAYKVKRAVRFAYMDFSTLAKRRAACHREVESTDAGHRISTSTAWP
jgi:aminoglycoside phosphotransferase family enzyme